MKNIFEHTAILTRDLEASLRFYRDLLGGTVVRTGTIPASGTELAYVQYGDGIIELLAHPESKRTGIDHIAFQAGDLDAAYEAMSGDGVEFSVAPKTAGSGVGRISFCADPDGIRVELLSQPPFRVGESQRNAARIATDIDHVSLQVDDLDASREFYARYFGAASIYVLDMSDKGLIIDYLDAGFGVLGVKATTNGTLPSEPRLAHLCFVVADIDAAVAELAAGGIEIPVQPRLSAFGGGHKLAVATAPEGTKIELQDRPSLRNL